MYFVLFRINFVLLRSPYYTAKSNTTETPSSSDLCLRQLYRNSYKISFTDTAVSLLVNGMQAVHVYISIIHPCADRLTL